MAIKPASNTIPVSLAADRFTSSLGRLLRRTWLQSFDLLHRSKRGSRPTISSRVNQPPIG